MTGRFLGSLTLEFGDFGPDVGRYARTLSPIWWTNGGVSLTIPAGTISDGATVPRPLWWLLPPWGDRATLAAVMHDYVCLAIDNREPRRGFSKRRHCDAQFHAALLACGVSKPKSAVLWAAVRVHSLFFWRPPRRPLAASEDPAHQP